MKHNVTEYLQACGMFKKITEDHNPNIIINLMEGYAQLYHNNLVKNNGVLDLVRQRLNDELEYVQFNHHAEGCGLEDRNIQDRYEAMEHGWERCFEAVEEAIKNVA